MEPILVSSFGRKNIQNAEWYAETIDDLVSAKGACVGDIGYLLTTGMPIYIKTNNTGAASDWTLVGKKYNS